MQFISSLNLALWFDLLDSMLKKVDLVLFGCQTLFHILSGTLSNFDITYDESNKFYASRVSQHVSFFKSQVPMIHGVPAAVDPGDIEVVTPPDLAEEPAVSAVEPSIDVGNRSSVAPEVRKIAPDVLLLKLPEATVQARAEAVSIGHRISHFPKHPL